MDRRNLLKQLAASTAASGISGAVRAKPWQAAGKPDWNALRAKLGARLLKVDSPLEACARSGGEGAEALFAKLKNPYFLGDEPGLTQTLGWIDGWTTQASDHAVAAESAEDVAAAISFARQHGVPPVVKGGGHSYFGNSNRAGSLLIWTRRMRDITLHDAFIPAGAPGTASGMPAVSIGAGAIWGDVYNKVAAIGGRYVQGGGCLTVGVAGFIQGGGFGSFSKTFGTGASNLLEAELVTADGKIRIANAHQNPDLFFALKGGGGGSFGVVTRLTLRTHTLPEAIGAIQFSVEARSDEAWRALVARVIAFYAEALFRPEWGEQLNFRPGRKLSVSMLCHGLTSEQIKAVWAPFMAWLAERPADYTLGGEPLIVSVPGRRFWSPEFLRSLQGIVLRDDRPGASPDNLFWATNQGEAGQVINAYQSAWLPADLLKEARQADLVDALVAASAHWPLGLHTNKGLAGGTAEAITATRATATNPEVLDAFALLICAAEGPPAWPGIPGHEPDRKAGRVEAARVAFAMAPIRMLVPEAGSYMSEADYFGPDWQKAYWGANYPRLLAAKKRHDPANLFRGHHCVGQG
ncbi:FAD-binding oxidoreductase [Novosphingobium sp.]|uniref:FAD-dependent oxidoreductase n=1 Tax=Novosphingobium sp. TaxID=1874826 RepID=UPI002622CBC4|nr:FAD-binding oxidoreductase [Novosphingobium sp.]